MNVDRRVVVTGLGAVTCYGVGVARYWENLLAGRSGIRRITKYDAREYRCQIAGEVVDFDITKYMPAKEARRLDTFCHYAVASPMQCVPVAQAVTTARFGPRNP